MYQAFYILTIVFLAAWLVFLNVGSMGHWAHVFLATAVISMGVGLFLRSSKN